MVSRLIIRVNNLISGLFNNKTNKQTVIKNTIWLSAGEVSAKLSLFVVTVLLTRSFGAEAYGQISFAIVVTSFMGIFIDFGFNSLAVRDISREHKLLNSFASNIIPIKMMISFLVFLLLWGSTLVVPQINQVKDLVIIFSLSIILQSFTYFFQSLYQATERMQYIFLIRTVNATLLLAFILGVIFFRPSLYAISLAYLLANFITASAAAYLMRKSFSTFKVTMNLAYWKKLLLEAWPFFAGIISMMVYVNSDSIMLGILRDYKEVGLYQAAYKILFAFQSINLIHQSLLPNLSRLYSQKKYRVYHSIFKKTINVSLLVLIPLGLIISFFSKEILYLIYGQEFIAASTALIILIWTGILVYFSSFLSDNLMVSGNQKLWFYSALIGSVINVTLNLMIIPLFGFNGAALTTLLSELVVFIIILYFNKKYFYTTFKTNGQ